MTGSDCIKYPTQSENYKMLFISQEIYLIRSFSDPEYGNMLKFLQRLIMVITCILKEAIIIIEFTIYMVGL